LLLGLGILVAAVVAQGKSDVPFQVMERGVNSGEREQGLKVIRTEKAFKEYLKDRGEDTLPKAFKDIDWSKDQIVVVFGGEQPSGGYGVEVKKINKLDVQRLEIEAQLIRPRPNTIVTQALTTPYIMIKMARQVAVIRVRFILD